MAWTPTFSVVNSRAIAENLLTYFEANQVETLLWAHGSALKPIARFENSRANVNEPVYPAILFSDDNEQIEFGNDLLTAAYSCLFLVMVQNASATTATLHARSYSKAILSMIANCGSADADDLELNVGCTPNTITLQNAQVGFDQIKSNDAGNDFMQQFEVRATYTISAGAHE